MDIVDNFYASLHNNKYVSTILTTFLVLYGSMAAPNIPTILRMLFNNPIFKIIFLGLIAYSVNKDPKLSVLLAVIFTITMGLLDHQNLFEGFDENVEIEHEHDDDHDHEDEMDDELEYNIDDEIDNEMEEDNVSCDKIKFDEKDIREGNNWKNICCCDFKNPPPQHTGACLDRIGDDVDKDDFDYERHVCSRN